MSAVACRDSGSRHGAVERPARRFPRVLE
jgi:hypothetical protein